MQPRYFEYGEREIAYLKDRDPHLGAAIDAVGHVYRELDDSLFSSVVRSIVGQQISTAAQRTVYRRLADTLGTVDADTVLDAGVETLQSCGTSFRKASYIYDFAHRVHTGQFDPAAVAALPDDQAIAALVELKGIGVWTAEMILLFCLGRPDILSFDDVGILRGMRMVYHHRRITRPLFEKHRRRVSPYGSIASLYFWEIASMNVPGYNKDFAPMTDAQKKAARKKRDAARRAKAQDGKAAQ